MQLAYANYCVKIENVNQTKGIAARKRRHLLKTQVSKS